MRTKFHLQISQAQNHPQVIGWALDVHLFRTAQRNGKPHITIPSYSYLDDYIEAMRITALKLGWKETSDTGCLGDTLRPPLQQHRVRMRRTRTTARPGPTGAARKLETSRFREVDMDPLPPRGPRGGLHGLRGDLRASNHLFGDPLSPSEIK